MLQVNLIDVDDHKPRFIRTLVCKIWKFESLIWILYIILLKFKNEPPITFSVKEEQPVNIEVGEISAVDEDIGENGAIDYMFIGISYKYSLQIDFVM